ncbi:WD40 repeat domain-containing protein [Catellatospora coxensis]
MSGLGGSGLGGPLGWALLAVLLVLLAVLWRDMPGRSLVRRLATAAVVGALLILAAPPGSALWGEPRGRVGLPDRLAARDSWWSAAELQQSPPGPVALVYSGRATHGNLEEGRLVLLAADGDRYRVLDVFSDPLEQIVHEELASTWPVLSPDGRLLSAGGYGVFDLVTGEQVHGQGWESVPRAWSADGRRVARAAANPADGAQTGWQVQDLASGRTLRTVPYAEPGGGAMAALSPDGSRIAVEHGDRIAVYPVAGGEPVTWPRDGWRLGDSTAWSPDGRLLAMVRRTACVGCGQPTGPSEVRVVDVETGAVVTGGAFAPLPSDIPVRVQGWRTPEQLVVQVGGAVEVFMLGRATPSRLLTLPAGVSAIEIATSRLADPLRPAEPATYGPPNLFLWLTLGICGMPVLLAAVGAWSLSRRMRGRSRRGGDPA